MGSSHLRSAQSTELNERRGSRGEMNSELFPLSSEEQRHGTCLTSSPWQGTAKGISIETDKDGRRERDERGGNSRRKHLRKFDERQR
jgi:hypothetical protein